MSHTTFSSVLAVRLAAVAACALAVGFGAAGYAQSTPTYASAKADGQVGEKRDGYLGAVGAQSQAVQDIVKDINNRRRAVYTTKASSLNSTVDEYAFTSGCQLIAATKSGEKYQGTDGSWKTRGAGAPDRDAKCP